MMMDLATLPRLVAQLDPRLDDRLSPLMERGKVALYLSLRARLGGEVVSLHTSFLRDAQGQDLAPGRYVLRVGERFVSEHGTGEWAHYAGVALQRARRVWKRKAAAVHTGPALSLSQLAAETDTRVVRAIETGLRQLGHR